MRFRLLTVVVLVFVLVTPIFLNNNLQNVTKGRTISDVFVGIDVAYGDVAAIEELVNKVSFYTNLFIIGSSAITGNVTKLNATCQYLYDKGMSFIIFQDIPFGWTRYNSTGSNWTETAKARWGDRFLGFYYMDESGGKQLDQSYWSKITYAENYSDMSSKYVDRINGYTDWFRSGYRNWTDVSLFMSDYALYWFDYKAGYDALFAEFGWNYSRQLNAALCRGAATVENKEWGVMVTWKYFEPPYVESGKELYDDLVLAYNNGAKYIAVFDSDEDYTRSVLSEEHLDALKQFWAYAQNNPRSDNSVGARTAVVLPDDYAYGFRGPEDKIWGIWPADNITYALSVGISNLLEQYGTKLDIIYDDGLEPGNAYGYRSFIYWNDTSNYPVMTPTPSPTAVPAPSLTGLPLPSIIALPTPNLTPTPSLTNPPSMAPTLTPSPTTAGNPDSTATPTYQPSPIQDSSDEQNVLPNYVYALAAGGTIASMAVMFLLLRRRYKRR